MGDATTTSFFPAKPLGCYGDGGAVFTNDDQAAELINSIRLHGKGTQKYDNVRIGLNSRLDTIQAAILLEKMKIFESELTSRADVATRYTKSLSQAVKIPILPTECTSAWAQYTIKLEDRDQIKTKLASFGVPTVIYYPIPLSQQIGYSDAPRVSSGLSVSEMLPKKAVSLPMHPYLKSDAQEKIIACLLHSLA